MEANREEPSLYRCPECSRPIHSFSNLNEITCGTHRYPLLDRVPCFLGADLLPKDFSLKGIAAFRRKGAGHSWALGHWDEFQLGELLGKAPIEGSLLLSFGGGPAKEKSKLAQLGYQVISLDIEPMEGTDVLADGHRLPFVDESFEMVTAFEVLEHLHSPWIAAEEIYRVLKPGGRFVGSVAFMKPFHESFFHMTHRGVRALLESVGFKLERVYGGQNPLIHTIGNLLPLGPRKFSNSIYDKIFRSLMSLRRLYWKSKNKLDPFQPLERFDSSFQLSFHDYEILKMAPSVLFSAKKISTVEN